MKKPLIKKTVESWTAKKFMNLNPYERNRFVEHRLGKLHKHLSEGYLPTHSNVAVGVVAKPFSKYKVGDVFRIDGTTRTEVWKRHSELIPPEKLTVMVYHLVDKETTDKIYLSYDNSSAAESPSEKMTGLFREFEFYPNSDKMKKGIIKSALNGATRYGFDYSVINENGNPLYLQTATDKQKLTFFWESVVAIDKHNKLNTIEKNSMKIIAGLLMISKVYGADNPRFHEMINNIIEDKTVINDEKEMDGVHYIVNVMYPRHIDTWRHYSYSNYNTPVVGEILYAMDCFMQNKNIPKNKRQQLSNDEILKFWQYYLDKLK